MPGAPLHSVTTGSDVSAARFPDSPAGEDVSIAADSLDIDLEPTLATAVRTRAVVAASLIDFLR